MVNGMYYLSYLAGNSDGYEPDPLYMGLAKSSDPTDGEQYIRLENPILRPEDPDARPGEEKTLYKSFLFRDPLNSTGYPYVNVYNAKDHLDRERIYLAVSRDGETWERYHNHDFEFTKINGQYILDTYYQEIPADLLQTELDTCWVNVGGENPAQYVRKYTGRAPIVHLKDFSGSKTENMYSLIGTDAAKEEASEKFEFRPIGYGRQDIPSILAASEDAGAGWVIVEQDSPSMGKTPMECAKMSIDYLKSIL